MSRRHFVGGSLCACAAAALSLDSSPAAKVVLDRRRSRPERSIWVSVEASLAHAPLTLALVRELPTGERRTVSREPVTLFGGVARRALRVPFAPLEGGERERESYIVVAELRDERDETVGTSEALEVVVANFPLGM
ncbi:MAG: hypothetical protein AUK47_07065 [Deltaproteobacteria bacterium CG2_30_63_29]|nr:MAG: hypothetical protein AUK47_07065 [Deltaproteobacteria bacterium CG2_30_63_29]PIV74901.1 MAG: hypothetical protein COW55_07740 [Rhodobacteraceae bacterium CG17_big_fil_post_rev_8_21_14_2_50_65_11]